MGVGFNVQRCEGGGLGTRRQCREASGSGGRFEPKRRADRVGPQCVEPLSADVPLVEYPEKIRRGRDSHHGERHNGVVAAPTRPRSVASGDRHDDGAVAGSRESQV